MQEWFENRACDGFNITPTHLPGGCEDFVELVVPELQRRGLFRAEYEDRTLRENLGLKRPVSRYAAAGLDRNLDAAKYVPASYFAWARSPPPKSSAHQGLLRRILPVPARSGGDRINERTPAV